MIVDHDEELGPALSEQAYIGMGAGNHTILTINALSPHVDVTCIYSG